MQEIGLKWQYLTGHYLTTSQLQPTKRDVEAKTVSLPEPAALKLSLEQALSRRRTKRQFSLEPLKLEKVSALCWAAYGVTETKGRLGLHTAPSAGATYPLELYVVVQNCADIEPGLYLYQPNNHSLAKLAAGNFKKEAAWALLDQAFVQRAALTFVWTAVVQRCARRYQQRAYRYIYLEAGHQCQNLLLAAAALGLDACPVGAFFDAELANLLGIDGTNEITVYTAVVG